MTKKNTLNTPPQFIGQGADKAALLELKEKYQAERGALQVGIMKNDLILKNYVAATIGKLFAIYRNQIAELGLSHGALICALLNTNNEHEVRDIISGIAYATMADIVKQLKDFINDGCNE